MMEVAVDEVISQKSEKVIPNKGMPILNNDPLGPIKRNFQRGNLIIKFDIQFPTELSEKQRQELTQILDEADLENGDI
jgi:DnaJ-class molecular chaperone